MNISLPIFKYYYFHFYTQYSGNNMMVNMKMMMSNKISTKMCIILTFIYTNIQEKSRFGSFCS